MKNMIRKGAVVFMSFVLLCSLFAGCGGGDDSTGKTSDAAETGTLDPVSTDNADISVQPQRGGIVTYSWYELSPTFDPYGQASWTTYMWANNAFENCLVRGDDGEVYPLVCEYEFADDGLSLKLWVRDGVCFSDGTPVTLDDVVASLKRAASFTPRVQTVLWDLVSDYEIRDNVLTFNFSQYNVGTFDIFCNSRPCYGAIMPKSVCEKYGDKLIDDPGDCIGTGPYKLVPEESRAGVRYEFTRNDYYVPCEASPDGNGLASPRRQYLDGLVCIVNNDSSSQLMSLMNGELDSLAQTDTKAYETNLKAMGFGADTYPSDGVYYLFFNCSEKRAVADINLRRAIAAVIDYDELQYACRGDLYDAGITSPVNCGEAYDTDVFTTKEWNSVRQSNIDVAKKYLAKSNYKGETLIMITDNSAVAAIFIEDLQAVGINCERQSMNNNTMIAYANDGSLDWDMIIRSNPCSIYFPTEMSNTFYNNWHNERGEELLALLDTVPVGSAESVGYWSELADLMAEEVPFVIFGDTKDFYIHAPGLHTNRQGGWRYWFNDWWEDPSAHTK
ncbi:MAG: hypothetical protein IJS22_08870 [Lachnospiraceae bacterium]|nr:hypothetical protein [Lachnospiraceae bacterium]